jgi:hypothetical protein
MPPNEGDQEKVVLERLKTSPEFGELLGKFDKVSQKLEDTYATLEKKQKTEKSPDRQIIIGRNMVDISLRLERINLLRKRLIDYGKKISSSETFSLGEKIGLAGKIKENVEELKDVLGKTVDEVNNKLRTELSVKSMEELSAETAGKEEQREVAKFMEILSLLPSLYHIDQLSDKDLISKIKKIESTFKEQAGKLDKQTIGQVNYALSLMKQELADREIARKIQKGKIKTAELDALPNVGRFPGSDKAYVRKVDASSYTKEKLLAEAGKTTDVLLIMAKDGPSYSFAFTKLYFDTKRDQKSLEEKAEKSPDSLDGIEAKSLLEALYSIEATLQKFGTEKKMATEEYLLSSGIEADNSVQSLYKANHRYYKGVEDSISRRSFANRNFEEAKRQYLEFLKAAENDPMVDRTKVIEAKEMLREIARGEISKKMSMLDAAISSVAGNMFRAGVNLFAPGRIEGFDTYRYLESQRNVLRFASGILDRKNDIFTLEDAIAEVGALYSTSKFPDRDSQLAYMKRHLGFNLPNDLGAGNMGNLLDGRLSEDEAKNLPQGLRYHECPPSQYWTPYKMTMLANRGEGGEGPKFKQYETLDKYQKAAFDMLSVDIYSRKSIKEKASALFDYHLYSGAETLSEEYFRDLINEYAVGDFAFENYAAAHANDLDIDEEVSEGVTSFMDMYLKGEEKSGRKPSVEHITKLRKDTKTKFKNDILFRRWKKALFTHITIWARTMLNSPELIRNGTLSQAKINTFREWLDFNDKHFKYDKQHFWEMTVETREELASQLILEIPVIIASGGAASAVGKAVTEAAARRLAAEALLKLGMREAVKRYGVRVVPRLLAAETAGLSVETEVFRRMMLVSQVPSGGLGKLVEIDPKAYLMTFATLGAVKVNGTILETLGLAKNAVTRWPGSIALDTTVFTELQYLESKHGEFDLGQAVISNLALSFGLRVGHKVLGEGSESGGGRSGSGRGGVDRARRNLDREDLSGRSSSSGKSGRGKPEIGVPEGTSGGPGRATDATVEPGRDGSSKRTATPVDKRGLLVDGDRASKKDLNTLSDFAAEGTVGGIEIFEGMTTKEALDLAKASRKRGVGPDFWASRGMTGREALQVVDQANKLEGGTSKRGGRVAMSLNDLRAELQAGGVRKAAVEFLANRLEVSDLLKMDIHSLLEICKLSPEVGDRLVERIGLSRRGLLLDSLSRLAETDQEAARKVMTEILGSNGRLADVLQRDLDSKILSAFGKTPEAAAANFKKLAKDLFEGSKEKSARALEKLERMFSGPRLRSAAILSLMLTQAGCSPITGSLVALGVFVTGTVGLPAIVFCIYKIARSQGYLRGEGLLRLTGGGARAKKYRDLKADKKRFDPIRNRERHSISPADAEAGKLRGHLETILLLAERNPAVLDQADIILQGGVEIEGQSSKLTLKAIAEGLLVPSGPSASVDYFDRVALGLSKLNGQLNELIQRNSGSNVSGNRSIGKSTAWKIVNSPLGVKVISCYIMALLIASVLSGLWAGDAFESSPLQKETDDKLERDKIESSHEAVVESANQASSGNLPQGWNP